jgi:hypothetical protein
MKMQREREREREIERERERKREREKERERERARASERPTRDRLHTSSFSQKTHQREALRRVAFCLDIGEELE